MVKVQETIEEALGAVRDELAKMERAVEELNALLFNADLYLAQSGLSLMHGMNPREALNHVGGLHASYQDELIRLRCVYSLFLSRFLQSRLTFLRPLVSLVE